MPTLYENFSQVRQYIDENNTSYVTKTELANASYASTSYVADYVATYGGGSTVIDENIIPKETSTYTLGDSSYIYNSAYVNSVRFMLNNYMHRLYANGQYTLSCAINGVLRYSFMAGAIKPERSDVTIGTSSSPWSATYTSNLYADNAYISNYNNLIWTGTAAEYELLPDYTTYQFYLITA